MTAGGGGVGCSQAVGVSGAHAEMVMMRRADWESLRAELAEALAQRDEARSRAAQDLDAALRERDEARDEVEELRTASGNRELLRAILRTAEGIRADLSRARDARRV